MKNSNVLTQILYAILYLMPQLKRLKNDAVIQVLLDKFAVIINKDIRTNITNLDRA